MATQIEKLTAEAGRHSVIYRDLTGVSTTNADETNLFVNGDGTTLVSNGFINLGDLAGGSALVLFYESGGGAGVMKVYGAPTQATTYQSQIGSSVTVAASSGDNFIISKVPQFLRITITRSGATNMTVRYWIIFTRPSSLL